MTLRIFENKEQAQIVITDNGKGISSDNLPHILKGCTNVTIHGLQREWFRLGDCEGTY